MDTFMMEEQKEYFKFEFEILNMKNNLYIYQIEIWIVS